MPKPIVASYCSTFLKPEMLHVYRQVAGLSRYQTFILTKQRLCAERYPFDDIENVMSEHRSNFIRRFYLKHVRKLSPIYYRGEFAAMVKVFKRRHADLMHIYFGHTAVHLLEFIEEWERPCVVSFHGADVVLREDRPDYEGRLRAVFAGAALVLARSASLARRLEELGCPPEKIRLNRTGIPLDEFPFAQRLMPADGEWHFVQASRLIPKKGLKTALEAFKKFQRQFPKAKFTIAGEGPMLGELKKLVKQMELEKNVEFVGFLDAKQLNALYGKAHVFLHPSEICEDANQEGIPNAMLEAMATGLPVVATLHGGIPEAVQHERSGFLVPERDANALAEALFQITESSEYLQIMGRQASESVRAEFESSEAIRKLESFYDEALQLGKPRKPVAVS